MPRHVHDIVLHVVDIRKIKRLLYPKEDRSKPTIITRGHTYTARVLILKHKEAANGEGMIREGLQEEATENLGPGGEAGDPGAEQGWVGKAGRPSVGRRVSEHEEVEWKTP